MFLPWITVFPLWQELWHYALCLRYQRFVASRCLGLARLGSFTKHEMEGEKERKKDREMKARGGGSEKRKDVMGLLRFREKNAVAFGSRCLSLDARARWSQERKSVGVTALIYHWIGLIGTVCFFNLCILHPAD